MELGLSVTKAPYAPAHGTAQSRQNTGHRTQDPMPNPVRQCLYLTHHNAATGMTEV